ncbi:MAG: LPS assembly lipoprotein LptE [Pyrinomonadaceae bacterium]
MGNAASFDELLNRAFQLAYFIHADKQTALRVAFEAAAKLEVAAISQTKRLYYAPGKRTSPKDAESGAARTKVFFSDRHLLQRLVYVESEKYERRLEDQAGEVDQEQMLVHFIKHLVRVTIKRSSFYVALGTSRLLHNYTTAETMEIYNVVVQDPDRAKDDYYYRSRKSRLMEEMKERFGALLGTTQGQRGEERFATATPAGEDQARLAHEALRRFTPWNTPCSVPEGFAPLTDEIAGLSTRACEKEDAVELSRIHATLHPDCYARLARALKLAAPLERLALPEFFLAKGSNNMSGRNGERRPPFLSGDELRTIKDELSEQAARRKTSHTNLLSVIVDGRELARLDPTRARAVRLPVSENAELIEVCAVEDGTQRLLAAHLLDAEGAVENRSATKSEIVLEGGQKICFALAPNENALQDGAPLLLTVNYRETELSRAFALLRARASVTVFESIDGAIQGARAFWKPAFAVLLLILCVSLFALLKRANEKQPDTLSAERAESTPLSAGASDVTRPTVSNTQVTTSQPSSSQARPGRSLDAQSAKQRTPKAARGELNPVKAKTGEGATERNAPEPERTASARGSVESAPADENATRTLTSQTAVRSMAEVKTILIEARGDQTLDQELSRALVARLKAGGKLLVTGDAGQADAALKITVKQVPADSFGRRGEDKAREAAALTTGGGDVRMTFTARLVNEEGKTLWQMSGAAKGGTRDKAFERMAARIVDQLVKASRRADKAK